MRTSLFALTACLVMGGVLCVAALAANPTYVTIGTGGLTGVYYPTGGAIAKLVNAKKDLYNIRATVESTGASVYNINAIVKGELDFGITQADLQYQAWQGLGEWSGKPQTSLRAVCALAPEMMTLVVAEDSGIRSLADLHGKTLSLGNAGSGNRENALNILRSANLAPEKDFTAEYARAADAPRMLQSGQLDGFFYTVGHPNDNILEATQGPRAARIVPILMLAELRKEFPYYFQTQIDMAHYPGAANNAERYVPTLGMKATLVTSTNQPDDVVYAITRELFENLETFTSLHPALASLTRPDMLKGLTAPLHPGALKYYKEIGLVTP